MAAAGVADVCAGAVDIAPLLRIDNVGQGVGTGPAEWEGWLINCEGNTLPAYCTPQALSDKGTHAAQQQLYCPTGHVQSPERNIARRGVPVYLLERFPPSWGTLNLRNETPL